MASLFRNSQSMVSRLSYVYRTATTAAANAAKSTGGSNVAVRDARPRSNVSDPIRPRPAPESTSIPLVGTALNTPGQLVLGLFLAISGYFIFNNYIVNPEFYKSLQISREASKVNSHAHSAGHDLGHKSDDGHGDKKRH
ncbi:unnamed protein product [Adineta ricciae]|uniref:Uncharacterized protein n=1 Tax=Adineta ricciae TaxID=249248 RepID=A0A814X6C7_ADIRI|nr:unnamed protein product [Adineta ricciae]CAF1364321.1 unnamed protein product [Adineta ricciae]